MVNSKFFQRFKNSFLVHLAFVKRSRFIVAFFCGHRFNASLKSLVFVRFYLDSLFGLLSMLVRFAFDALSDCSRCFFGLLSMLYRIALDALSDCSRCFIGLLSMLCRYSFNALSVFIQCFIGIRSMLYPYSFNALSVFIQCFIRIHSMLYRYSFNALSVFIQCFIGLQGYAKRRYSSTAVGFPIRNDQIT